MERNDINEKDKALEKLEETIQLLSEISESSVVHLNLREQEDLLRSEKRRIEGELESKNTSGNVGNGLSIEVLEDSIKEYATVKGLEYNDAVENLIGDINSIRNDLLPLYKMYSSQNIKMKDKELAEELNDLLKDI